MYPLKHSHIQTSFNQPKQVWVWKPLKNDFQAATKTQNPKVAWNRLLWKTNPQPSAKHATAKGAQAMPEGRETALGRVRRFAPHRGYAAIKRYVQLPPVHGRTRATRMHGILIKADWMPPATFDTHFTDKPHKISRVS